jgi:hypothetical protein
MMVTEVTPEDVGCPMGQTLCAGSCVNTNTSPQHCGACGMECDSTNGVPSCAVTSAGVAACAITCNPGFADCDMRASNGCETATNTLTNCGACGRTCAGSNATGVCTTGSCVLTCNAGFSDCDDNIANGCEVSIGTTSNCGTCGRVCNATNGTAVCSGGSCTIACNSGFANCDGDTGNGCEAPLNTIANCGVCGRTCSAGMACSGGACSSICTMTTCAGACVDLATNPLNCGACGTMCSLPNATPVCRAGSCAVGVCSMGFADCDARGANGCEVSTQTDANNCGGCGTRCAFANASASCVGATCTLGACLPGFANCDGIAANGCEVDTRTSTQHCGSCGNTCRSHIGGGNSCMAGVCTPTCNTGYGNCDGNLSNGCESQFGTNASCGGCGRVCTAACANTAGLCSGANPGNYARGRILFPPAFIDACAATGRVILMPNTDDQGTLVALPFAQRFYATTFPAGAMVNVTTNGWIGFDPMVQAQYFAMIPDSAPPNNLAAAYLTDLITGPNGVCVATIGMAPSRLWVAEWQNAAFLSDRTRLVTFEIVLSEGSNVIQFYYDTMATPPTFQTINVGVESPGGVNATTACTAPSNCTIGSGARLSFFI